MGRVGMSGCVGVGAARSHDVIGAWSVVRTGGLFVAMFLLLRAMLF